MDDFLHNLRSGNLRKPTGHRRQYGDQQGKQSNRRVTDRRKRDGEQRVMAEALETIKETLTQLAAAQQQMTTAQAQRAEADDRTATALERIAASLEVNASAAAPPEAEAGVPDMPPEAPAMASTPPTEAVVEEETPSLEEKVCALRDEKLSYARIADQLNQEGIPTPSGRGQWRGTTVQRVYQRHTKA